MEATAVESIADVGPVEVEPADEESAEVEVAAVAETDKFETGAAGDVIAEDRSAAAAIVGSSAIIATIEEAYQPYDLAAADIQVWNFYPLVYKPYCILDRNNHVEKPEMWSTEDVVAEADVAADVEANAERDAATELDAVAEVSEEAEVEAVVEAEVEVVAEADIDTEVEVVAEAETETVVDVEALVEAMGESESGADAKVDEVVDVDHVVIEASADCLLDELVWNVDAVTPKMARHLRRGAARRLGRLLGSRFQTVASSGHQVANHAVDLIAGVWPAPAVQQVPESVGEALMVRAGAVAAAEASVQVAEVVLESDLSVQADLR
ncbi:hypothetical protein RMSM_02338 [Rhodopirellula maiorica SM1]|uniref:Uncharacterized protein n=1 Tax=Rhodopirellula maiorica SM1 TaxID=1265738 RepID=M5RN46_9BACT|nr:hypothetical protein [Rhodopirellula maiorica]EMI20725.1 hypothetical protein RMSM_02338 [Rhodopirellula maiorica SM1]